MNTVDEILEKINVERSVIDGANERIRQYTEELRTIGEEEWDWIPVRHAAEFLGVSAPMIYRKIDAGELDFRCVGSKKLVKRSELKGIDDRKSS